MMVSVQTNHRKDNNLMRSINIETILTILYVHTAWRTLQGYEAMNMICKGQVKAAEKHNIQAQNQFISQLFGLTA